MYSGVVSRIFWLWIALAIFATASDQAVAGITDEVSVADTPIEIGNYTFGMRSAFRLIGGVFDEYGNYTNYPNGSQAWSLMTSLSASYRFSRFLEGDVSVPLRQSEVDSTTGSSDTTSMGGPSLSVRAHLGTWAHLVFHGGFTFMSPPAFIRSSEGDTSMSLPQNLGDGAAAGPSVNWGLGGFRSLGKFRFALDAMMVYYFNWAQDMSESPPDTPQLWIQPGMRFQLSETGGYALTRKWTALLGFHQAWQLDTFSSTAGLPSIDALGTANRTYSSSVGAAFAPDHHWRFTASFDTPFPFYDYAVNQAYAPSVSLSMTYSGGGAPAVHE